MGRDGCLTLFGTKEAKDRYVYRLIAVSIFVCICLTWIYRVNHLPRESAGETWVWIGLFYAEFWFALYWVSTQSVRWNRIYRHTFKDSLSQRYEKELPGVDIFVCTADHTIEPPLMVINTVLSVMAYDYPPEKLSVYLSDDGGSDLMFYALLEASSFSKIWLPFCKRFKVEPRSPAAYFSTTSNPLHTSVQSKEWSILKESYESMKNRIETATKLDRISEEIRRRHKGFLKWTLGSTRRDHPAILEILINGRDPKSVDLEGQPLPTLVYLAREKRPQYHHNFKAGAMNALIRVSSKISNGQIILNVDCDMYSNNSNSVRDALCFFMDQEKGHEIGYVQYPQMFENITKSDIYASSLRVTFEVEIPGFDGNGGPPYIGSGCFHRRENLCGMKYCKENKGEWKGEFDRKEEASSIELEETAKLLASCTFEENTQWGKEMGLKYGCPVEDVLTGLSMQCKGWRSIYFNPERRGFLGLAPTTLLQSLVQHKRWSEGDLQIFLSKYCPFIYGHGRIKLGLQMAYCVYCWWALNCFATLYFVTIPSLCLLKGISLFPRITSLWFMPFAYVIMVTNGFSLFEFVCCGGTVRGWWNDQRMWMFKRTTSYLFAFMDTILKILGFSQSAFVITAKVAEDDVSQRYEQEMMEFGTSSPMFTILASLGLLNLFSLVGGVTRVIMDYMSCGVDSFEPLALQIFLCGLLVLINLPVYQGLFFRKDKGCMPSSVTFASLKFALLACILPFLY